MMKKDIVKQLEKFRALMEQNGMDVYYIPTDDFHGSEFVSEYFKAREYLSGFTGSAGILIITKNRAGLFTDGRYFLQAEEELKDTGIELFKSGLPGVLSVNEFLFVNLEEGMCLGFDGRCVNARTAIQIRNFFEMNGKRIKIRGDLDLVSFLWEDRPKLPNEPAFILDLKYAGEDCLSKLNRVRTYMQSRNVPVFLLTSLDDIAWLLNIRGNDVKCNPVCLAYMIITMDNAYFYCGNGMKQDRKVCGIYDYLTENGIMVKEYFDVYKDISAIVHDEKNKCVIADLDKVNYRLFCEIADCRIMNVINPTTEFKAVKNNTEVENERQAHIKDAVAYIRFLYWFKKCLKGDKAEPLTELMLAGRMLEERKKMEGFISESFEPIVAYGPHGAIVHYSPDKDSDAVIDNRSFVLIDTGGHYLEGTTDITRTIVCGELTEEEKYHYTLVLKGNLALGNAVFLSGITGANLDILARQPLWEQGLDYNHGTGHGVGYLLNVHEGPNSIRYKIGSGKNISAEMKPGMITSNEPGFYMPDEYGIRLENMIVCVERNTNEFGKFLAFETLTLVPFELEAVRMDMLEASEIQLLNEYHARVYERISPYLNTEEKQFLKEITRQIG